MNKEIFLFKDFILICCFQLLFIFQNIPYDPQNQDIFSLQSHIKAMRLNEHNASTSVYLEQINNHIQIGEGYSQLRKHLFRQLHQLNSGEAVSEDKLSDAIVSSLAATLNRTVKFHRSAQTFRAIQIIEDLLTYGEEIMTPAMHTEQFVSALFYAANPKIVTFDATMDADCRSHALGIFLYWFERYGREQQEKYELFIKAFKELKDKKLLFPNEIMIKPNDFFKKEIEKDKNAPLPAQTNESKTNRIILEDIQAFTVKTQNLFKQNFKAIATTEYVRLIKHKSKVLFQFTSKPNDFQAKQKNLVKDLYKRLRVVLKELDKYKETSLQSKKSQQTQKQYVEAKITPKKEAPLIASPLAQKVKATPDKKTEAKNAPKPTESIDLLDMGPIIQISSPQKKVSQKTISPSKPEQVQNFDLLNDNPKVEEKAEEQQFVDGIVVASPEQKKETENAALFQVFSTPKKQVHEEEGNLLAKHNSSNSQDQSPAFDNQKMAKNPYSFIPDNLNLTPTSSMQDEEQRVQEKPMFSLFGLFNPAKAQNTSPEGLDQDIIPYDFIHKKGKSNSQTPNKIEETVKQQPPKEVVIKDIVNSPTYKKVTPVNYEAYANFNSDSPQKYDEQSKFQLTPKKKSNKQLQEAQFDSPKSVGKIKQSDQ